MSAVPGESPSFDFSLIPQEYFDRDRIAEEVVWPLVNHYWRGEWRLYSALEDSLNISRKGSHNGGEYLVSLTAHNSLMDEDDPEEGIPVLGEATFELESIVHDERRDMILSKAEEDPDVAELDEDDTVVSTCTVYNFDTDGDMQVTTEHIVKAFHGEMLWYEEQGEISDVIETEEDSDDDELGTEDELRLLEWPDIKLQQPDMDQLESGLYVLRAPDVIMATFKAIRQNPLSTVVR